MSGVIAVSSPKMESQGTTIELQGEGKEAFWKGSALCNARRALHLSRLEMAPEAVPARREVSDREVEEVLRQLTERERGRPHMTDIAGLPAPAHEPSASVRDKERPNAPAVVAGGALGPGTCSLDYQNNSECFYHA